jgi:molecular chaperone IbpA
MATLDFTPFYHSTVGFDRLPDLLTGALSRDETGYPPYNIEKAGEDAVSHRDGACRLFQ